MEIHLANGHVVVGTVDSVLWEAGGEWIEAVSVKEQLPSWTDQEPTSYERVLLWDHVLEVRPSIEEASL